MTGTRISRLPKDPGVSGWEAMVDHQAAAPQLSERKTADILIIGAGFTGLAAARQLSLRAPDARVVILEASKLTYGPAGRNSGFMIDLPHDLQSKDYGSGTLEHERLEIQDNRLGIEFAASMARDANLDVEAFDLCGKYNAAATENGAAHIETYRQQLDQLAEPYEVLDTKAIKAVTGSNYYKKALFTPGTAMIQPAAFIRAAANIIVSNRIILHENSPVIELKRDGKTWLAITPKGSIAASKIILAVNGHLNSFGFASQRIMHVHTYGSMTRALSKKDQRQLGGHDRWGITSADPLGTSVRRITWRGEHRIVIRNRTTYDPDMEVSDKRVQEMGKTHDKSFAARFPNLENLEMEYRWGGRLALTRNGVSIFGELEENLYSANVQNGLGTARGTFQGMMVADLALGIASEPLTRLCTQSDPKKLAPPPFMTIGANAYLRWLELRANQEL